jgi:SAM-dependent methyltransferase
MAANVSFTGPQFYDEILGPLNFGPFAAELVRRLPPVQRGAVLELACGTGAVTRLLRRQLPDAVDLVATDLSATMLEYARARLDAMCGITWRLADMLALPFEDGAFTGAVCGFGVMFPADPQAALKETRRVLTTGAPLAFSVWDGIANNPHGLAVARAIEARFPGDARMRFHTPYEMNDEADLQRMLAGAGFAEVRIESKRLPIAGADPARFAAGLILGTPRASLITERGVDVHEVVALAGKELARMGGSPYNGFAQALLVSARAA